MLRPSVIYKVSISRRGAPIYSIYYIAKLRKKNFINDTPWLIRRAEPGLRDLAHESDQLRKPFAMHSHWAFA